ncbi:MAG: bifunctional acetate--CoA ligase family protein/GNAT family N-acetyltransferase [Desulfobacteraceae bacterium]
MGLFNLDKIFRPRSIAVIGAGEKPGTIGRALMHNLTDGGFEGDLWPVNPNYADIFGLKAHGTIGEIGAPVDLAVIATPIATVPEIVAACSARKVGGAIVISAGGKEIGAEGSAIEDRIRTEARKGGLRIVGPNCLGIICPVRKLNASFAADMPNAGKLAFISQSGAICTAILDLAFKERIGFSHFVSIGSMLDVDFGDLIDYLGYETGVSSILLYIENLTNIRKFMSAARAVSRIKPIVVLKAGRSAAGARAAASHTGAMAGEDAVYDAAFDRAGVVRVNTIDELFDCAELMAKQPRPRGPRLAIITNGGGPGVMATDALARHGLEPAPLDRQTLEDLDRVLPQFWSRNNPIDILGDASPQRYAQVLQICTQCKGVDGVLVMMVPQALTEPAAVARELIALLKDRKQPIFTSWMGGRDVAPAMELLNQAGIPTYETPERAIGAFVHMARYARNLEMAREVPPRLTRHITVQGEQARAMIQKGMRQTEGFLTETDAKAVLEAYGIRINPTEPAADMDGAVHQAEKMGYPVAMKVVSPDIIHKTEANGVQLDLRSTEDVRRAYQVIMDGARAYKPDAEIRGVALQPYIDRPDYEILLGAKHDANFGPVILFGSGGIFTEVVKDRAIALPPLNQLLVKRLMEETRIHRLLHGYRNRPPVDMEQLTEMILRLAQLAIDFPEIAELDLNPVVVKNGHPQAVDARILLKPDAVVSPLHLVISPYPAHYETAQETRSGLNILIRPIRPEDAQLFAELFKALSPTTIYYRFFTYMKSLSPEMLARMTQIDYDREMALVAIDRSADREQMLGAARIIADPDGRKAEFSVLVGDPWQGKGIGAKLLEHLLYIARQRNIEHIWGCVLKENVTMLRLGKKAGFATCFNREEDVYDLTIDLPTAQQEAL